MAGGVAIESGGPDYGGSYVEGSDTEGDEEVDAQKLFDLYEVIGLFDCDLVALDVSEERCIGDLVGGIGGFLGGIKRRVFGGGSEGGVVGYAGPLRVDLDIEGVVTETLGDDSEVGERGFGWGRGSGIE